MAMVESQNVMQLRPLADPSSQQEMTHDAAVSMIGTARARRWFKSDKKSISTAASAAAAAFPSLMLGMPYIVTEGLNPIEQIQTLLELAVRKVAMIEQTTKIPKPEELIGLQNTAATIEKLVQGMQGDPGNEPKMKEFAKALNQLNNEIKKLQQHLQMEMQKQQQQNGNGKIQQVMAETQAKIAGKTAETQQKLKAKELAERQKRAHKDAAFVGDERRKNAQAVAETFRGSLTSLNKNTDE
jgi:hypothetical protein